MKKESYEILYQKYFGQYIKVSRSSTINFFLYLNEYIDQIVSL